jgi:hypothetical protein
MSKKYKLILFVTILSILMPNFLLGQYNIVATRFKSNPIITPAMFAGEDGLNINGPSLIKVPKWIKKPLGKYYLYFAHHTGKYIRLAYANHLKGPWTIYEKGTLKIEDCGKCNFISQAHGNYKHIASPDVLIDTAKKEIVMYFHCPVHAGGADSIQNYPQVTFRSTSTNGIDFKANEEIVNNAYYLRVFKWNGYFYAFARGGDLYRSKDGISNFEEGSNPFHKIQNPSTIRHLAVLVKQNVLYVFYSRIGDMPESILVSKIPLLDDWNLWSPTEPVTILKPTFDYEGVNLPLAKSVRGEIKNPVRELRDPYIFECKSKVYLLYSVSGESGIAIAELKFNK